MIGYLKGIYVSLIILSWNRLSQSIDWNDTFTEFNVPCSNPRCYQYASHVTKSMNRNANPCNDFYEYVCGQTKNPMPHYYPVWSTPIEMSMKSAIRVKNILEEKLRAYDNPELQKAKKLYRACMKLPYVGMLTHVATHSYVKDAGYFPMFSENESGSKTKKSWVNIHNYYFGLTGDSGLYEISSMGDDRNNFEPLLHLTEVHSPFGRIVFSEEMKVTQKKLYEKYLTAILSSVFPYNLRKVSPKILASGIEAVINFRCEIQAIKAPYSRVPPVTDSRNVMTIGELEHLYKTTAYKERLIPIPWVKLFHSIYGNSTLEKTIKDTRINVSNKSYQKSLLRLIKKTPEDVIVNHMHLYFVEKHLEFDNHLERVLIETIFVNGEITGSVKYLTYKWHVCILTNSMHEAIGKAYVKEYLPASKKKEIEAFVGEIRNVLSMYIHDSTWLNIFVIDRFKNVIDDMKIVIGYPEYYDDESLRNGYYPIVQPGIAKASYSPALNRLIISAAVFQLPLYDAQLSRTILYGSAGAVIARELHHAFSPYAVAERYDFNIHRSGEALYSRRVDCFLKKYDNLPIRELNFLKPSPTTDGSRTLDENISDAMALKIAYEAFRKDPRASTRCSLIFPAKSCAQLFFIAYGLAHCSKVNPDVILEEVLKDNHLTDRVRVNTAVSNMEEFAKTFNCPKKAPLNSKERCDLWK